MHCSWDLRILSKTLWLLISLVVLVLENVLFVMFGKSYYVWLSGCNDTAVYHIIYPRIPSTLARIIQVLALLLVGVVYNASISTFQHRYTFPDTWQQASLPTLEGCDDLIYLLMSVFYALHTKVTLLSVKRASITRNRGLLHLPGKGATKNISHFNKDNNVMWE